MLYCWTGLCSTAGPATAGSAAPSSPGLCPRGTFLHVVTYSGPAPGRGSRRRCAARRTRRRLPRLPLGASLAGPRGGCGPCPSKFGLGPHDPKFEFGRWLVTAPGTGPGGQRIFALKVLLMSVCAALSAGRGGRRLGGQQLYTLRRIFVARVTSRDNKRFVLQEFCHHCARSSRNASIRHLFGCQAGPGGGEKCPGPAR